MRSATWKPSSPGSPMSSSTTSGSNSSMRSSASRSGVRGVDLVAFELEDHGQRVGRVLIVVDHENAARRCASALSRRGRRDHVAVEQRQAQLEPWCRAARRRWRCCTLPPCISIRRLTMDRPMPSPPCERSSVRSPCTNRSNTFGSSSLANADAVVGHAIVTSPPLVARLDANLAAGLGVLGGVGRARWRGTAPAARDRTFTYRFQRLPAIDTLWCLRRISGSTVSSERATMSATDGRARAAARCVPA